MLSSMDTHSSGRKHNGAGAKCGHAGLIAANLFLPYDDGCADRKRKTRHNVQPRRGHLKKNRIYFDRFLCFCGDSCEIAEKFMDTLPIMSSVSSNLSTCPVQFTSSS